ncbi:MAG TPA: hypothetical protein VIY29_31310, partial [Ktedonobacteraceae bacterium]
MIAHYLLFDFFIWIGKHLLRADNAVSQNNPDKGMPTEGDHAQEHRDPGIRLGESTVMLSTFATL